MGGGWGWEGGESVGEKLGGPVGGGEYEGWRGRIRGVEQGG